VSDFETDLLQWRDGERRLADAQPERQPQLERVVDAVVAELRRRLGGPFTAGEVAELYEDGTDWAVEVAVRVAPDDPWAWDPRIVVDAAFARYVRGARDFAGGRRLD
jgi:hypothetical protein